MLGSMGALLQPFGEKLVAGDRWKWTVSLPDYPADVWKLVYAFRGASALTLTSTASGSDHLLDALPDATEDLIAGRYAWQAFVEQRTDATEHYELARGQVQILPDVNKLAAGSPTDLRSQNQRILDAIRATIEGTASREERQYQVGGRSLEVRNVNELLDLEGVFAARVRREQIENGTVPAANTAVHVRFANPS